MNKPLAIVGALLLGSLVWAASVRADDKADLLAAFNQGKKLHAAGKLKEAAAQYEKAVQLAPGVFGENAPATAGILNNLGLVYSTQGKLAQADPVYRRALEIYQKAHGEEHASIALVLQNLAILNAKQKKYAAAEALFQRGLEMREKLFGKEHVELVNPLNALATMYGEQARFAAAEKALRRLLAIREKAEGKEHAAVTLTLHKLADVCAEQKNYAGAEQLYLRELAIREKVDGKEHPAVALSLLNLGQFYVAQNRYADAIAQYQRSLAIREKVLGAEHRNVADVLNVLGMAYGDQSQYAKAEPIYLRALRIYEKDDGPQQLGVAMVINNLANLYSSQGKYAAAVPLFQRSLTIRENAFGKEHVEVATALNNLAIVRTRQGHFAEAVSHYRRCLSIQEKAFGKDHPRVATVLNNLASLQSEMGKHDEAERLLERSLAIREKAFGTDDRLVGTSLLNLANVCKDQGKYAEAEPLYRRGLAIFVKIHGAEHSSVAMILFNLANLHCDQQRFADAAQCQTRLRHIMRQFLLRELPSLSAQEQRGFLNADEKIRFIMAMSLAHRQAGDPAIVAASAGWLLNGKAIALEAQTIRGRLEREIADAEGQAILREIQAIRSQQGALALKARQPEDAAKQREQLEARRRDLEKKLAPRSSAAAKLANPWVDLADVRPRVPANGILIDIVRLPIYRYGSKTKNKAWTPTRYVAWLIPAVGAGDIRIVDLGDAAAIDGSIQSARRALESTVDGLEKRQSEKKLEADVAEKLAAVAKLVFEPLKPHLGNARNLIVSPDGDLWLLPWAALPTGKDRYLIEDYSLRFVVTGRDLVDYAVGQKPATSVPLILADPDYNLTPAQVAEARPMRKGPENTVAALTRSASDDLRGIGRVKRLPGTVAESRQAFDKLKTLTGEEPKLYLEGQASETVVKATRSPRVLVLATHGFFLKPPEEDPTTEPGGEKKPAVVKGKGGKEVENPLLRCGLLLAGANKRAQAKENEDDGILTGLEIVGLDLRGTQLVVLSACETAVGEVQTGEGVAGLRQAFQLAGAESVLATLWQISDSATGQLMNTFYDELARGTERAEALTRAQRQFIKERRERAGAAHPFFWASFTLTGK